MDETKEVPLKKTEAVTYTERESVQGSASTVAKPGVGSKYHLKREEPTLQQDLIPAYSAEESLDLSVGNHDYTVELKEEGNLGVFLDISQTYSEPTIVELNAGTFHGAIKDTLSEVLIRLLRTKTTLTDSELVLRADDIAENLATGCCVIAYLKMRAVHFIDAPTRADSLRKPRVASDLPIPSPFAFAIQQLGAVTITDVLHEVRLVPAFASDSHSLGAPTGYPWRPAAYAQSMEYARTLGLRFNIVDLAVKNGTAWWLLRGHYEDPIFEYQCIYPEVNYTDSMAVTATLFLKNTEDDPSNDFVNLTNITTTYAVIMRNPHPGINVSSYLAIDETADEVWKNA